MRAIRVLAAKVLTVSMLAGVALIATSSSHMPPITPNATVVQEGYEIWEESVVPGAGDLRSAAALGRDDIWVVGERANSVGSATEKGFIAHWDGKEWKEHDSFFGQDWPMSYSLSEISARASDDVWALGTYNRIVRSAYSTEVDQYPFIGPLVVHWNGYSWYMLPPLIERQESTEERIVLLKIAAVAPGEVWGVGYVERVQSVEDKAAIGKTTEAVAAHWDGNAWNLHTYPSLAVFAHIAAVSRDDIWAFGPATDQGSTFVHWDGKSWSSVKVSEHWGGPWSDRFTNAAALASNNVWLVGSAEYTGGSVRPDATYAFHWNGNTWEYLWIRSGWEVPPYGFSRRTVSSIDGNTDYGVWAVGVEDNKMSVLRWDGKAWQIVNCPAHWQLTYEPAPWTGSGRRPKFRQFTAVAALSPNEIVAVGNDGLFVRFSPGKCPPADAPPSPFYPLRIEPSNDAKPLTRNSVKRPTPVRLGNYPYR